MKTKNARVQGMLLTAMVLCIISLSPARASALEVIARSASIEGHILYLPVPGDVSNEDVRHAGDTLRARLYRLVDEHLASQDVPAHGYNDLVVIFLDQGGAPILPDLEETRRHLASSREKLPEAAHELTFTFRSPVYHWEGRELAMLHKAVQNFYPVIKDVYGEPAFAITVNVRKDPAIHFGGYYSPTTNEIVLNGATQLDVFCHEMIHAFRDDDIIGLSTYEEGMTVAAEVEVLTRLKAYTFWDEHHCYPYDVFYDGLSNNVISSFQGRFDYGSPLLLLRYQLAGYAWGKVLLEDRHFLSAFNRELYKRALSDPDLPVSEPALLEIASALLSSVEGKPFELWYAQQGILGTDPPGGSFIYQNSSNFVTYFFNRDSSGAEQMQQDAVISWAVYDYRDVRLDSGSGVTSYFGWISFAPRVPNYYIGRIKMVASGSTAQGKISSVSLRTFGEEEGIFGVLPKDDSGVIEIVPLDDPASSTTAEVANGAFSAASLTSVKGRFVAVFAGNDGRTFSRQFNKDASNYFLLMAEGDMTADLSVSQSTFPSSVAAGENIAFMVAVTNAGSDQATDIVLKDTLPVGTAFVSAVSTQGSCVEHSGALTCALNSLPAGSTAFVIIEVETSLEGIIANTAEITHNGLDPDMSNNTVTSSASVSKNFACPPGGRGTADADKTCKGK